MRFKTATNNAISSYKRYIKKQYIFTQAVNTVSGDVSMLWDLAITLFLKSNFWHETCQTETYQLHYMIEKHQLAEWFPHPARFSDSLTKP